MQSVKEMFNTSTPRGRVVQVLYFLVLCVILVDLAIKFTEGPTMDVFFPRLYTWVFVFLMGYLMWSIVNGIQVRLWRVVTAGIFAALSILAVSGTPDSFPFYAPGQDQHVVEGQRTKAVGKIIVNVGDTEVRPGAFDRRIDDAVIWLKVKYKAFFRSLVRNVLKAMVPLDRGLRDMPMWVFLGLVYLIAWRVTGYKTAVFSTIGLFLVGVFDLWAGMMVTMTVVGTATFLSIAIAIPTGIAMSKSDRIQAFMKPMLDMAQTMPSFVYLIPAIFFLGIGMVPAVFATIIYAVPPGIRLTNLGIRLVSSELKEAALAFGTTPWQMLVKVELPLARPTIMAGINQTVMMALAMVVIAALVGAGGLGADVYAGVQQLEFGRGLTGGLAIVVLAVVIDRISQGFAKDPTANRGSSDN